MRYNFVDEINQTDFVIIIKKNPTKAIAKHTMLKTRSMLVIGSYLCHV
jgi:hypothetical protein